MTGAAVSDFIPVCTPVLDGNEKRYLAECIDSGWVSSEGPFVSRLEAEMAQLCGKRHGVALSSGTAALEAAVRALQLGEGDEVIIPDFTIISCALAVIRCGATPVAVDANPYSWCMDIKSVRAAITPRTKAIMAVHIYGLTVDMPAIRELAAEHGLFIIEDAAEAHGQTINGAPCGSFGDVSVFSFYPNKLVTTGEGGMALTDDDAIAARLRSLRNLCFTEKRFVHHELGWNWRMSNVQAALGVAQLERLQDAIAAKIAMGRSYDALLAPLHDVRTPMRRTEHSENHYWVYGIVLSRNLPIDAEYVMARLHEKGIGTRPFFWPMHEQPVFQQMGLFEGADCPVSSRLGRRGLYIPSGIGITPEEQQRVVSALREVLLP